MYEKERKELIENLKTKGITDINVLNAMIKIERHLFIPNALEHLAYKDIALPIGFDQTISQPFTVAFMTQSLSLNKGDKVLEIGTGSGYQSAILYAIGMDVYSIEKLHELYKRTQQLFDKLGIRVHLKCGDGTIGWNEFAPYDGIIVTAGSPSIPESLKKQLKIGGKLVIPIGSKNSQILNVITKIDVDKFHINEIPEFVFVPLIGKEGWKGK